MLEIGELQILQTRVTARVVIQISVPTATRVVGRTNGALTGYGGGLERKRWLLQHEGVAVK